jgi:UDP-N-acetylmuramoyl-tripeptide--D-alanyl-D-alanine ligase
MDDILLNMSKRFKKPVFYPDKNDFYHCEIIEVNPWIKLRSEDKKEIQTKLVGVYNFTNIAAALCIAKYFDVDPDKANSAIASYIPINNRSQIISKDSNTIILDAYNANPDSMKAAIENLSNITANKKVVILGDMFELGDLTQDEHKTIGKLSREAGIDEVIFCGERMKHAWQENKNSKYFETRSELENYIENRIFEDSLILIKGSRAMALEVVTQKI